MVCSIKSVHLSVFFLNDQRSHVVSSFFIVFCVRSITEWELFGPPTRAVHGFISQILHVKSMYYLGVVFLDMRVYHRFVVMVFNIKSFVSWITSCSCPSSNSNCCDLFNSYAGSLTVPLFARVCTEHSTNCLAWTASVMVQQVYVPGH